jgi:hypothetical protein
VWGLVRPDRGVGVEVLLEEPGREVTAEFDSPLLPLIEGHELTLTSGIEHQIEGGRGVSEPALAESLLGIVGWGGGAVHGCVSGYSGRPGTDSKLSYPGGPSARTRLHPPRPGAACAVILRLFLRATVGGSGSLYPNDPLVFPDFAWQSPQNPEFYPTTPLHGVSLTL